MYGVDAWVDALPALGFELSAYICVDPVKQPDELLVREHARLCLAASRA